MELALSHSRDALAIYATLLPADDPRIIIAESLVGQLAGQTDISGKTSSDVWGARALPSALALSRKQVVQLPVEWGRAVAEAQQHSRVGDVAAARASLERGHRAVLAKIRTLRSNNEPEAARQYLRKIYAPWLEMPLVRSLMPVSLISEAYELKRDDMDLPVVETLLEEAVFAGHNVWGNEHPYIARALTDLANVLREQNKLSDAEPLARKALQMRRKLLGMDNPDTIQSYQCLIEILQAAGKQNEADDLSRAFGAPADAEPSVH